MLEDLKRGWSVEVEKPGSSTTVQKNAKDKWNDGALKKIFGLL